MVNLDSLPTEVLYRITAQVDTRSQRNVFESNKTLYSKWHIQPEETDEYLFVLWCLDWLGCRQKVTFDAAKTGLTAYFLQERTLNTSSQLIQPEFFEEQDTFLESMAVITSRGFAFPLYDTRLGAISSQVALWRRLDTGRTVPGFGLATFLQRPNYPTFE